jgi:GNAT superfamily N-acetyltransferase
LRIFTDTFPMVATVRLALESDLDALLGLYIQLSPGNAALDRAAAAEGLAGMLAHPDIFLLVADVDGRVGGTVTLVLVPNLTHDARPWIQLENMVVDQSIRQGGVGRALISAAEDLAARTNAYKIQLQSADHRHVAHAFYEAAGFVPSSVGFRRYFE